MEIGKIFREVTPYIITASPNDLLDALNSAVRQLNFPNPILTYANVSVVTGREFDIPTGIKTVSNVFVNGVEIDTSLTYPEWMVRSKQGFGGTDTVLTITDEGDNVARYRYVSGTPLYLELGGFGNIDDLLIIGDNFSADNTGLFTVVSYGGTPGVNEYFEVTNITIVEEADITLGTGSIRELSEADQQGCCITSDRKLLFISDLFDANQTDRVPSVVVVYGTSDITDLTSYLNSVSIDVGEEWAEFIKHHMLFTLFSMPAYKDPNEREFHRREKDQAYRVAYATKSQAITEFQNKGSLNKAYRMLKGGEIIW